MGVDPVTAGLMVAAPVVGGLVGNEAARGSRNAANNAMNQALAQYANIKVPTIAEQLYNFTPEMMYQSQGQYTPEQEQLVNLGPSEMAGITTDPRLRAAQMQALGSLSELGQTGLAPGDIAAERSLQRQVSQQEQARQNAILAEMARRGTGGSGMELAAKLNSSQQSAQRGSEASDRLAQQAQARALQALTQSANLGSQMERQQFGEQADIAKAADAIAAWNAANQQNLKTRNVNRQNTGQLTNLQNAQQIANMNAQLKQQAETHRAALPGQRFNQQIALAGGMAGQYGNQAQNYANQAANTANMGAGVGAGIGGIIGAVASAPKSTSNTPAPSQPPTIGNAAAPNIHPYMINGMP